MIHSSIKRVNWFIKYLTMRKIILSVLSLAIVVIGITSLNFSTDSYASAQAEIAMELTTGTILTEGNAHARLPMASTTKILTAIIVIEDCNLDEEITVPNEAVGVEGSSIYLQKDEKIDIRDLLYGLMLRSGNDSAAALAIHHSGSIENFAAVMNERAKKIGAMNSNFKNPSGLPDDEHYTTAYDLCTIASYAMKNETFKEIVSTTNYTGKYKHFVNKNKLLYKYEGANGIKTGYTIKAGRCLVSSAEKNGMDIVCVVLNCPEMYERSIDIFESCFKKFKLIKLNEGIVFNFENKLCHLNDSANFVIENADKISYRIEPVENCEDIIAQLLIYNGNELIFTGKLYNI